MQALLVICYSLSVFSDNIMCSLDSTGWRHCTQGRCNSVSSTPTCHSHPTHFMSVLFWLTQEKTSFECTLLLGDGEDASQNLEWLHTAAIQRMPPTMSRALNFLILASSTHLQEDISNLSSLQYLIWQQYLSVEVIAYGNKICAEFSKEFINSPPDAGHCFPFQRWTFSVIVKPVIPVEVWTLLNLYHLQASNPQQLIHEKWVISQLI